MDKTEMPDWWANAPLADLTCKLVDGSHNPPKKQTSGLPMLSAINVFDNKIHFSSYRLIKETDFEIEHQRTRIQTGDVLLTIVGAIGRTAVVPDGIDPFTLQRSVAVLTPAFINPRFLMYQLESPRIANFFKLNARGTAQKGLYLKTLGSTDIWLPPLPEQDRIVAKIEELFSELDDGVESLEKAREQLKVYRQALLRDAFEGKLTADWRAENADKLDDADAVRDRVLAQRRSSWEAAELQRLINKGAPPKNDLWKQRYNEPVEFEAEDLPDLPPGWCWVSLDELVSGQPRSMQSGPFGSNLLHSEFQDTGVLVIGIDNVLDGEFSMGSENRISQTKFEDLKKYEARPGDLLITVMASLGRTCVIPRDLETAIITKHVYRVSMDQRLLSPEFYNFLLQTETVSRRRMFKNAQGQTRPGLNSGILRALPVPLCGFDEQKEIVGRVSEELSRVSRIQELIEVELKRTTALRQAILRRAFSGQLVAQDPNDEPASVLLERIRAEKEEVAGANGRTRRKDAA